MLDVDEEDFYSILLIMLGLIIVSMLTIAEIKEYTKYNKKMKQEIETCKLGKIVSISEKEVRETRTIPVTRPGVFSPNHMPTPGIFQQILTVPEYHVRLDNGIELVSKDEHLIKSLSIGNYPTPELCNKDTLDDDTNVSKVEK